MAGNAGLTSKIKGLAREKGADLVGIAPVERFSGAPAGFGPLDHFPSARSVVVIAKHIPDAVIERWGQPHINQYQTFGHGPLNVRLIFIQQDLASLLEDEGYMAYPVSPLGARGRIMPHGGREWRADFSNRHAAVAAGLGEFGWFAIVITPQYGPRQRFASIITDAPLEPDPLYDGQELCDQCMTCVEACPMSAISRDESVSCAIGDKVCEYSKVDHWACYWSEVSGLIEEAGTVAAGFNTNIRPPAKITLEEIEKAERMKDYWQVKYYSSYSVNGWCGRCLHACTKGKDTMKKRLWRSFS